MNKFEMEGFMAQKGLWNLAIEKILRERGALPMEEGHAVREHKAMNEENFLSSWLREDGREKEERMVKVSNENEEERSEKRRREGEKEENETATAKRRCEGFVSVEAFAIFSQGRDLESCGDIFLGKTSWMSLRTCLIVSRRLGWLCLWCLMSDVTDVPCFPFFCGH